jgi:iron-sulfur cluster assembly accessory protein
MTTTSEKIIKDMTIEEIFSRFPQKAQKLAQVLSKAGLQCVGCSASTWETIESGVFSHGHDEKFLYQLLGDLNAVLEEETHPDTVTLTERAAKKFSQICEAEGKKGWGLRFDEVPAGCSGFEYTLGFSEKMSSDDMVIKSHGVDIHIAKKMLPRLLGSEIDYVDGLQSGFKISNPNVRSSCGCGSSHGY